jgi:hypothetical protein
MPASAVSPHQQRFYEDQFDHVILSFYQLTVIQQLPAPSWIDSVSGNEGNQVQSAGNLGD